MYPDRDMDAGHGQDESTSDYAESSLTSEFTSVTSNRLPPHSYDNGRRYQGLLQRRYGLPNDDVEQDREAIKHKLYVDYIYNGNLFASPIGDHPQKIVDLGTGFGYWAHDVAEKYPSARVIGTDLSAIQPIWSPPNVEFRVEDMEDEFRPWTRIYDNSDLIHMRSLLQTMRNPKRLFERCFENLAPGGWIECHEIDPYVYSDDGTYMKDHPLNEIYEITSGAFSRLYQWNIHFTKQIADTLRQVGFVNVHERRTRIPLGRWHHEARMREMGLFSRTSTGEWAMAMLAANNAMGISEEAADRLAERLVDALDDVAVHGSMDWLDVWAQKPSV